MSKIILLVVCVLFASNVVSDIRVDEDYNSEIYLPGRFLKAYSVAYEQFRKEGYNLANYKVVFKRKKSSIDIFFIPIPSSVQELDTIVGGRNSSGEGINYNVSFKDFHINEVWYSR